MARNIIVRGWCPGNRVLAMDVVRGSIGHGCYCSGGYWPELFSGDEVDRGY